MTVPQHAFALTLNLATKAYRYAADVERGDWQRSSSFTLLRYPTFELKGLTIGIIGFGVIGRGVARIPEGFGMRVLAHDAFPIRGSAYGNTPLDELLAASDFVTIHSPLTEQTRNLIDAAALQEGRLAGAGFDVLTEEPPSADNPLLHAPNIILTPHSAWSTREARQALIDQTAINIRSFIAGAPRNVVS